VKIDRVVLPNPANKPTNDDENVISFAAVHVIILLFFSFGDLRFSLWGRSADALTVPQIICQRWLLA